MAKSKTSPETTEQVTPITASEEQNVSVRELASAITNAIDAARPIKKTVFTRRKNTPWTPKDGSPKLKLKRKMFHHSLPLQEKFLSNEEIEALNKVKPGVYCDGWVKVRRRNDKALDIDYPVRTKAQLTRLSSVYKITDLTELAERCAAEAADPKKYNKEEDLD